MFTAMRGSGAGDTAQLLKPAGTVTTKWFLKTAAHIILHINQIGLGDDLCSEYFHPGFVAKAGARVPLSVQLQRGKCCSWKPGSRRMTLLGGKTDVTVSVAVHLRFGLNCCLRSVNAIEERQSFRNEDTPDQEIKWLGAGGAPCSYR